MGPGFFGGFSQVQGARYFSIHIQFQDQPGINRSCRNHSYDLGFFVGRASLGVPSRQEGTLTLGSLWTGRVHPIP